MSYWVSEIVFKYLVLTGFMPIYSLVLIAAIIAMFFLASISSFLGIPNTVIVSDTYMFIILLVLPFLAYLSDVYQALQLRLRMNESVRRLSYPKLKRNEKRQQNNGKFEWIPTNFSILNAIMHKKKRTFSHGDLGRIAGVDRQTAASAIRKLLASGLVYREDEQYKFSGVEFEVSMRKGKKVERVTLNSEDKRRLKYLFEIMCFVSL